MAEVSVILCTHNPRPDFLKRVLQGLNDQTLPPDRWELLLIDNASRPPVSESVDLNWHPHGRIVPESTPGLTPARLKGITEARADLLVFVDDDAVLADDYLQQALTIAQAHPMIGAFGGTIELEFQETPPDWTRTHCPRLAERTVEQTLWSNFAGLPVTTPWGVGMCLRRRVAEHYRSLVSDDPVRLGLDRNGNSLMSGGDDDMARTSHLLGLATGLFPELKLLHMMPPERLTEDYLVRLTEAQSYSGIIVESLHGGHCQIPTISPLRSLAGRIRRRLTMSRRDRRFLEAKVRGQQQAVADLAKVR